MTEWIVLEEPCLGHPLRVSACPAGGDCAVVILGGSRPHVGAVSAAYWEEGNLRCETSAGRGHRDDVVSRRFAQALAMHLRGNVSVSCGIHYDGLTKEGLAQVLAAAERLLEELTARLESNG